MSMLQYIHIYFYFIYVHIRTYFEVQPEIEIEGELVHLRPAFRTDIFRSVRYLLRRVSAIGTG